MKILFLDIDGVLNHKTDWNPDAESNTLNEYNVIQFNRILTNVTDLRIVLMSAWRYTIPDTIAPKGMEYLFRTHGVHKSITIMGCTCRDEYCFESKLIQKQVLREGNLICTNCGKTHLRSQQVAHFIKTTFPVIKPEKLLCLDNMDLGFRDWSFPFVQTDEDFGLSAGDASKCISILKG